MKSPVTFLILAVALLGLNQAQEIDDGDVYRILRMRRDVSYYRNEVEDNPVGHPDAQDFIEHFNR